MRRSLYVALVRLHPRAFRDRFSAEMLEFYDQEAQNHRELGLFADALHSLARQWVLRGSWRRMRTGVATYPVATQTTQGPFFHTFDAFSPRRSALVQGASLSLLVLAAVVFAIGRSAPPKPNMLFGTRISGAGVLPVDFSSASRAEEARGVRGAQPPSESGILDLSAVNYYSSIPLLYALDTDHDGTLSDSEIRGAPNSLRSVDSDGDGTLTAKECGVIPPAASLPIRKTGGSEYSKLHPLPSALDSNGDGSLSKAEIAGSAEALWRLDTNRDGRLTPFEVLPKPMVRPVGP